VGKEKPLKLARSVGNIIGYNLMRKQSGGLIGTRAKKFSFTVAVI
jgi:hypothetical protein